MAEKRMVHRNITKSDKLLHIAHTRGWRACFLYAAHIPYLDKSGRMKANHYGLKGTTWEVWPMTAEDIAGDLDALADVGLVRLYRTPKGEVVMQYAKFDEDHGGFNKPHPNEPDSEYPDPDADGCRDERVSRVVGNIPTNVVDNVVRNNAPQRSDKVASEYEYEKELERELEKTSSPPTPPQKTPAPSEDEDDGREIVEEAFTAIGRRRSQNHATGILAQQAMKTYAGLQDLQGVYKLEPTQYRIYAAKLLDLARDHGDELTAAALEAVVLSSERIKQPLPYIKKILANHAAESARLGTTEVGAIDFKGDLERLFGAN